MTSKDAALAKLMRDDFPGYCKRLLRIKSKDGQVVPFELNVPQMMLWREISRLRSEGKPCRICVLKARQYGISTFSQAYLAHQVLTGRGQNALTIAHNLDMAGELFGKIELMYDLMPEWAKPPKSSKSRGRRLALDAPNFGLFFVDTAENRDAGRSGTFQHVHATELPLWPAAKQTMDGLLQSVPTKPGTTVIVESTAAGMGDYFHDMWRMAESGENGFTNLFIPWHAHTDYRLPPVKGEVLPQWVKDIGREHGLDKAQMTWYLQKYRDMNGDMDKLFQEHPSSADVAFLVSGRPFFPSGTIRHYSDSVTDPIAKGIYKVVGGRPKFVESDGPWHFFEYPKPGEFYVIGGDPSTGRALDNTAATIVCGNRIVATLYGSVDPESLAEQMAWAGYAYNRALLAPERNSFGLVTVLKLVNDLQYPNVYTHKKLDTVTGTESNDYGWNTTSGNRSQVLENFAAMTRDGSAIIPDRRVVNEMKTFIFKDDAGKRAEANQGCHDDLIMSTAIALQVSQLYGGGSLEVVYNKPYEF